jgi:hypothetical protein
MSKLTTYIDGRLVKYDWYRKWQANRSRKRLAKQSAIAQYDGIESYEPSDIIHQENERYDALLAERKRREDEYDARIASMNTIWKEVLQRFAGPDGSVTAENQKLADAEFDKLYNERYPQKG